MTNPTIRELVDMLPKQMLAFIPAYPRPDGQWRTLYTGHILSEEEASDMILGDLVRRLGERGQYYLERREGEWGVWLDDNDDYGDLCIVGPFPTPLEAAVRAVGAVSQSDT